MALQTLEDAFVYELQDVLNAEMQLVNALPKLAERAGNASLRTAIEHHLEETRGHIERLEAIFRSLEIAPMAKKCEAMEGLLKEVALLLQQEASQEVLDTLLIAAAQKVEHYEIAIYGALCTWARMLGHDTSLGLLKQTLNEEEVTDQRLTHLAIQTNRASLEGMTRWRE